PNEQIQGVGLRIRWRSLNQPLWNGLERSKSSTSRQGIECPIENCTKYCSHVSSTGDVGRPCNFSSTKSPHPLSGGVLICGGSPDRDLGSRRPTELTLETELDNNNDHFFPQLVHTLTKDQKMRICEWICHLKFSDGYASNLARCVDLKELRMHVIENYDCHVFMQKLIPIAFGEMLPEHVGVS
ncbi:hypothetical protein Sango_0809500, partial [Sesamum angolense]